MKTKPRPDPTPCSILVVDDHPLFREALIQLLAREPGLACCGEADSADTTLKAVDSLKPDLVLLDLRLREGDALDLIKTLKSQYPTLLILVVSQMDERFYAERVLRAGASGYVMKCEAAELIRKAIQTVLSGELYLSPPMAIRLLHQVIENKPQSSQTGVAKLSDRELQVFQMLGAGLGTLQIAQELRVSPKTIESHRENIKHKLNLPNATALLLEAAAWLQKAAPSDTDSSSLKPPV